MKKANLYKAKANLSKLVKLTIQGEEVIICEAVTPVAKLIAINDSKKRDHLVIGLEK